MIWVIVWVFGVTANLLDPAIVAGEVPEWSNGPDSKSELYSQDIKDLVPAGLGISYPKTLIESAFSRRVWVARYAEVDCLSGLYTGYRYRFWNDPFVHKALLYWGSHEVNWHGYWGKPYYVTSGMEPRCLYS